MHLFLISLFLLSLVKAWSLYCYQMHLDTGLLKSLNFEYVCLNQCLNNTNLLTILLSHTYVSWTSHNVFGIIDKFTKSHLAKSICPFRAFNSALKFAVVQGGSKFSQKVPFYSNSRSRGLKFYNIFNETTIDGAVWEILKIMLSRLLQSAILEAWSHGKRAQIRSKWGTK